jgi:hypothetical protein
MPFCPLQVSLYWLITVRLSQSAVPLVLQDEQVQSFSLCVALALVGQSLGLVHMVVQQLR